MPRIMTYEATSGAFAQTTGQVFLVLIKMVIQFSGGPATVRVVNNTEDIVSNGQTFTAYPYEILLPEESEGKVTGARLRLDNVYSSLLFSRQLA